MSRLHHEFGRPIRVALAGLIALAGFGSILSAAPQDALGDGRGLQHRSGSGSALDRSLQVGSGGINVGAPQEDLRARNLIVTGNVAGGRGFRGDVGYTADRDFRGFSSDDVSYAFRAGSAFSDPRLARAGSMGDRLHAARSFGTIEYGRSAVAGSLTPMGTVGTRLMFDQTSAQLVAPETRRSMMDLATAARLPLPDGSTMRMRTGAFLGVRSSVDRDAVDALDLGMYDASRLKADLRDGKLDKDLRSLRYANPLAPESLDPRGPSSATDGRSRLADFGASRVEPGRLETGIRAMDSIVGEVDRRLDRAGARDALQGPDRGRLTIPEPRAPADRAELERRRQDFSRDLEVLRRRMRGDDPLTKSARGGDRATLGDRSAPGAADERREDDLAPARRPSRSFDEVVEVLRHGQVVERISDVAVERLRDILQLGEDAMARQAYFLAEQHFTTALILSPTNPTARLGLANAQLGAGLIGSAATTLRGLYIDHPELIDAKLAPNLLPPRDRMVALLSRLDAMSNDPRSAVDAGLMMAYIGRQLGDRAVIERGVALLAGGSPADATLASLLKGIWLGSGDSGAADETTPSPPAAEPPPAVPEP